MASDDGGPAFPTALSDEWLHPDGYGMSLHDLYAGLAMFALINDHDFLVNTVRALTQGMNIRESDATAGVAFIIADSMIADKRRREKADDGTA